MLQNKPLHHIAPHTQRYLLTGILTVIPIWITWVVFEIILRQLTRIGRPGVWALSRTCLLYTSPSPRDGLLSRMPSSA